MKPTFISSNLSLKQLGERVGDRIVSRIVEMCEIIKIEGDDRRLKK
jgi:DNA replication protein DnaC